MPSSVHICLCPPLPSNPFFLPPLSVFLQPFPHCPSFPLTSCPVYRTRAKLASLDLLCSDTVGFSLFNHAASEPSAMFSTLSTQGPISPLGQRPGMQFISGFNKESSGRIYSCTCLTFLVNHCLHCTWLLSLCHFLTTHTHTLHLLTLTYCPYSCKTSCDAISGGLSYLSASCFRDQG